MPNDSAIARDEAERGREADSPAAIPSAGWIDILKRAWAGQGEKNLSLIAGGVTYAIVLALFPGLAALVSIYGLVANPAVVEQQAKSMSHLLPGSAQDLITSQLHQLVTASGGALGFGVIVGILLALWSASRGMSGMITALDIAYGQPERRSFFRFNLLALILTIGMIVGGLIVIALVAVLPAVLNSISLGGLGKTIALVVEWPLLIVVVLSGMAILYRYAPDRDEAQWRWLTPGAVVATALWLVASVIFTVYVANFGSYNKTYGSLGAIIVLLTWLWLSCYVMLLGAEINAEAERQTRRDTTTGTPQALGTRGAAAADTVGQRTDRQ